MYLHKVPDADSSLTAHLRSRRPHTNGRGTPLATSVLPPAPDSTPSTTPPVAPTTVVSAPTTSPPQQRFKVGDIVQAGKWKLIVHSVQNPYPAPDIALHTLSSQDPGTHFVAVDIEVTDTTGQVQLFLDLSVMIEDPAGHKFGILPMVDSSGSLLPAFPGDNVDPGTSRRGVLYFPVPNGATSLDLVYQDSSLAPAVHVAIL